MPNDKILSRAERIALKCEQAHAEIDARDKRAQEYAKARKNKQPEAMESNETTDYLGLYKFSEQASKKDKED